MDCKTPLVIFVIGLPGAGKGTQCKKISECFGFEHLSAGELLREEMKNTDSEHCELIRGCYAAEKIVPIEITMELILRAMRKSKVNKFLIDGFPRNMENIAGWNQVMGSQADLRFVLHFKCSQEKCGERILDRGRNSERLEDSKEHLEKRFRTYHQSSAPVVDYYERQSLLRTINAEPPTEQVFEKVKDLFQQEGLLS